MKRKQIKENIKKETKKIKQLPNEFINTLASYCIDTNIHMKTLYQLCKVKHIDQMLETMYETVVNEYKLHIPTIDKLKDIRVKTEVQHKLDKLKLTLPRL